MAKPAQPRLLALDGLRGFAALAVMELHATRGAFPAHGGLAVDLFFLMSGFVLAGAYEPRLREGLAFRAFMAERIARLYPVYLLGLVVGVALLGHQFGGETWAAFAAGLVFAPSFGGPHEAAFWLDGPLWSLSLEILANGLFAAGLWRLSNRALAAIAAIAALALAVAAFRYGQAEFGYFRAGWDYWLGYARVCFSFPLGWLIWRCRAALAPGCTRRASGIAVAAVAVSFVAVAGQGALVAILLLFPVVVTALALGPQPAGWPGRLATTAGMLSYPLYVLHAHVVILANSLAPPPWRPWLIVAGSLAVAWLAARSVDPLGRRLLTRAFAGAGARQLRGAATQPV
ncbi:MAG TPA: acyltransferase [Caulobacteraceae bacterium]|nr:acyltransferase [Caulobacteraceae bacterium]